MPPSDSTGRLLRILTILGLALGLSLPGLSLLGPSSAWAASASTQTGAASCGKNCPKPARPAFASADEAFIAARNAAGRSDAAGLEQAAAQAGNDPLIGVYLDYWRLKLRLAALRRTDSDTPLASPVDDQARDFVARHGQTIVGDLARRDWLLALGRRQMWTSFDQVYPDWILRDEAAPRCYAIQSRLSRGEAVMAESRDLIMQPRELGDACNDLLVALAASGQASPADLWQRLELALEAGKAGTVRRAAMLAVPSLDNRQLETALSRPAAVLDGAASRELTVIGLVLLSRNDPNAAADRMSAVGSRLKPTDRAFVWSQIAANGMRKLLPESLSWTREARTARPSDETLGWMTRAALRSTDWSTVRSCIERMSDAGRSEAVWTYWLARSLQAQGDKPEQRAQARALFAGIAGKTDFYSQLATEELGQKITLPPKAEAVAAPELAAARANPGFARAARFYELGLRPEGNREWNFQLRGMSDRQLLASAQYARQRGFLDRMINSSDRTRTEFDFEQRYPSPFAERLQPIAREQGVDPAWVYGLIRQESRFITDARSSVGASGLMQIMPTTATWIARKMGVRDFTPSQINDLDTNLQFGTFYLKTVFEDLDRSAALASAGYNAGPGRPRAWRGTLTQPVEGAIFAELVPFTETRGYIKAVMSNTVWYALLFGAEAPSLKAMLGQVQPGPAVAAKATPDGN
jgi:soluble lytic murein transglycosylase